MEPQSSPWNSAFRVPCVMFSILKVHFKPSFGDPILPTMLVGLCLHDPVRRSWFPVLKSGLFIPSLSTSIDTDLPLPKLFQALELKSSRSSWVGNSESISWLVTIILICVSSLSCLYFFSYHLTVCWFSIYQIASYEDVWCQGIQLRIPWISLLYINALSLLPGHWCEHTVQ